MRKFILPIFLLYFISSFLALILFMKAFYDSNLKLIVQETRFELFDALKELNFLVKTKSDILSYNFSQNEKILFYIKDLNSKNIIKKDFILDGLANIKKIDKHSFLSDKEFYLIDNLHAKKRALNYQVVLKSKDYKMKINLLLFKTSFIFVICFVFVVLIGYFIIKFSLRALTDKISSLNSFIESATHEINTPISVILMSIEMFETNPKKYLFNIKTASQNLSNLHENLINLTLKNSQNNLSNVNLKNFLEEKIIYFAPIMSEKKLKFNLNLKEVNLKTDIKKFDIILENLISNAIKYSDENSEISSLLDESKFEIENYGEEIKASNLNEIFKKYTRFSKTQAGFGIGLSLVKKYADELDYKIFCKNEDKKTKFALLF